MKPLCVVERVVTAQVAGLYAVTAENEAGECYLFLCGRYNSQTVYKPPKGVGNLARINAPSAKRWEPLTGGHPPRLAISNAARGGRSSCYPLRFLTAPSTCAPAASEGGLGQSRRHLKSKCAAAALGRAQARRYPHSGPPPRRARPRRPQHQQASSRKHRSRHLRET
eukprot:366025-Chlamydomonas_euryale.AAC.5